MTNTCHKKPVFCLVRIFQNSCLFVCHCHYHLYFLLFAVYLRCMGWMGFMSYLHIVWKMSSSLPICVLAFIYCSLRYCSAVFGICLTCIMFLVRNSSSFHILYSVWSAFVVSITLLHYGSLGLESQHLPFDGYSGPCKYNSRSIVQVIVFVVLIWHTCNAFWCWWGVYSLLSILGIRPPIGMLNSIVAGQQFHSNLYCYDM